MTRALGPAPDGPSSITLKTRATFLQGDRKKGVLVNSRVPKTVRHGNSLHIICPKLLNQVPEVCTSIDAETIDSSPSLLESQTSVRQLTLKLFGSSPSRFEYRTSVRRPTLKLFGLSPSRLFFNQHRNCWLTSQASLPRPSQPLITHVLGVYLLTATETKMSPFVCTAQNYNSDYVLIKLLMTYFITQCCLAILLVFSFVSTNLLSPCQLPSTRLWTVFPSQRLRQFLGLQHITPLPMSI